jgi:HSP20 family molecular chaperone IbpA
MAEQTLSTYKKPEQAQEEHTRPGRTYVPSVDIYETPDSLWLRADMPGVDENSLEVNVVNGLLSIEGWVSVKEYENLQPVYTEYNIGNYSRRFTLSNEIDTNRITAKIVNGVLELELPKAEKAKPRQITISAS